MKDRYKCVVGTRDREHRIETNAHRKVPSDKRGIKTVDNGQTLCFEQNLFGFLQCKRLIVRQNLEKGCYSYSLYKFSLYKDAVEKHHRRMVKCCKEIFDVYNRYGVNHHIEGDRIMIKNDLKPSRKPGYLPYTFSLLLLYRSCQYVPMSVV